MLLGRVGVAAQCADLALFGARASARGARPAARTGGEGGPRIGWIWDACRPGGEQEGDRGFPCQAGSEHAQLYRADDAVALDRADLYQGWARAAPRRPAPLRAEDAAGAQDQAEGAAGWPEAEGD